jgi:two-component system, NarL family, sensor histidine kinase DesK
VTLMAPVQRVERSSAWLIRLASSFAVTFSVVFAALVAGSISVWPPTSSHMVPAIGATAFYLVLHLHHLRYGLRGESPPWGWVTVAAMGAVIFGVTPLLGPMWVFAFFAVGSSILLVAPPGWAVLLFGAIAAAGGVATAMFGQRPGTVAWTTAGVVFRGAIPYVFVWMVGALRDLQLARATLARDAVVAERAQLEERLSDSIGVQLDAIAARGQDASDRLEAGTPAIDDLDALIEGARAALSDARRLVASYRRRSAREEVDSAADLLRAAGMDVRLTVSDPGSHVPLDDRQRRRLREAIADLLRSGPAGVIALSFDGSNVVLAVEGQTEQAV